MNLSKFNSNDFTESRNPALSLLFHTILNELGNNSDEVQKLIENNKLAKAFTDCLSDDQMDMYNNLYWEECMISTKIEAERFILGFKLASLICKETSCTAANSGNADVINSFFDL